MSNYCPYCNSHYITHDADGRCPEDDACTVEDCVNCNCDALDKPQWHENTEYME